MTAQVNEGDPGSLTSPSEAPEAVEKAGTSPVTYAVPDGRNAAAWVKERTSDLPVTDGGYVASADASTTDLGSYAAVASEKSPEADVRNFEGSILSAAQSGFPAE